MMSQKKIVSIIIPCYNAAGSVGCIVRDVLAQGHEDFEVILVSNGVNQQEQLAEIERLSMLDSRIHYYSIEQAGVSRARNFGLARARGTWIAFADVDDAVSPDWLERMLSPCENTTSPELISCGYLAKRGDLEELRDIELESGSMFVSGNRKEFVPLLMNRRFGSPVWNKLIRRDFLERHGLRFDEVVNGQEDRLFNLKMARVVERAGFVRNGGYIYIEHSVGSLSSNYQPTLFPGLNRCALAERAAMRSHGCGRREIRRQMSVSRGDLILFTMVNLLRPGCHMGFLEKVRFINRKFSNRYLKSCSPWCQNTAIVSFVVLLCRMKMIVLCFLLVGALYGVKRSVYHLKPIHRSGQ
jgi:glycosyltransferase involved in cell wall biosynthesis